MVIAAESCLCHKFDAKVQNFRELCKKKVYIYSTINVNTIRVYIVHKSAVHKVQYCFSN